MLGSKPGRIGRKRLEQLTRGHFCFLKRAPWIRLRKGTRLGVKANRLSLVAARIILRRQLDGMKATIDRARKTSAAGTSIGMHIAASFMWDEVSCKYKLKQKRRGQHPSSLKATQHILVSKGGITTVAYDTEKEIDGQCMVANHHPNHHPTHLTQSQPSQHPNIPTFPTSQHPSFDS